MAVIVGTRIERMGEKEIAEIAYRVMGICFDVHGELGRCFEEKIYQRELAFRIPGAQIEVPVEVVFEDFRKTYYVDLVVENGAMFELKTVEALTSRHRGQLLNYLLLADTAHGKLVNFRPDRVQHEFVNNPWSLAQRTTFSVDDQRWQEVGTHCLKDRMVALLHDWGTMLDLTLYEEIVSHFCGHLDEPFGEIEIQSSSRSLGKQQVRLIAPDVALRITAFPPPSIPSFITHLHRFCTHTTLRAIQWLNITPQQVTFTTLHP